MKKYVMLSKNIFENSFYNIFLCINIMMIVSIVAIYIVFSLLKRKDNEKYKIHSKASLNYKLWCPIFIGYFIIVGILSALVEFVDIKISGVDIIIYGFILFSIALIVLAIISMNRYNRYNRYNSL